MFSYIMVDYILSNLITSMLLHIIIISSSWVSFNCLYKFLSDNASFLASYKTIYLTLVINYVMVPCFSDL